MHEEGGGEGGNNADEPASRHSRISSDSTASTLSLPTPPDGGWGWVVVVGSFVAHCIADGAAFTFGVLYTELLRYFKESKGKTALVGSLFVSVPLLTAPIASALTNKYGCRCVTMTGGVIASAGFILSAFVNSVEMLCVTFGVIAGFGLSMVYVPAVCIVAFYFEKRRAFATGVAVAGSGIGTFLFAPLIEQLIEEYGWHGTLFIIGGIMLNIVACGATFRPLVRTGGHKKKVPVNQSPGGSPVIRVEESSSTAGDTPQVALSSPGAHKHSDDELVTHSLMQLPTYVRQDLSHTPPFLHLIHKLKTGARTDASDLQTSQPLPAVSSQSVSSSENRERTLASVENGHAMSRTVERTGTGNQDSSLPCQSQSFSSKESKTVAKRDVTTRTDPLGSKTLLKQQFLSLPMNRNDIFYRGSLPREMNNARLRSAASCPDVFIHSQQESNKTLRKFQLCGPLTISREAKHILRKMMDIALLKSPVFLNIVLHSFLLYMWYDVPYVYAPDKALKMGISEGRASFLISIIGIASTVGQVVIGYIGDLPKINALHFYNFLTCVAGVSTMLVPVLHSYPSLCAYAAMYGFFISGNYALTTIILVNLLGMEKLTNAYGIIMFAEGISNMIGPPLAGWISDYTGSYDTTFYLSGIMILISGLMLSLVPCLQTCDKIVSSSHMSIFIKGSSSSSSSNSSNTSLQKIETAPSIPEKQVLLKLDTETVI